MKKIYSRIILLLIVLVGLFSLYYCFILNSNSEYYKNYEMQILYTNKSMEKCQSSMASIVLSMFGNKSNSNITTDLEYANNSTSLSITYSQEMLRNAKTDSEKKYAEQLIKQSYEMKSIINLLNQLSTNTSNREKTEEIFKQIGIVENQIIIYQRELENIRSNDQVLNNHLEEIEKKLAIK